MRRTALGCAVAGLCALAACEGVPTSLVVTLENGAGADRPLFILMRAYGARGVVYGINTLELNADTPEPAFGTVVVFRRGADLTLRLQAVGMRARDEVVSEGVSTVTFTPGEQRAATLVLLPGRLSDLDVDSVPDVIDDCLGVSNVEQGGPPDGGVCAPPAGEAALDGGSAGDR